MSWVPPPGAWLALRVCSVDSRPDAVPVVLRALPSVPEAGGEALCCVLAGLVPAGCGSGELPRWRPDAVRFLSALRGRDLRGQVAEVLPSPRLLVLLNVPTMARRMQDLGLASRVPEGLFRSLLESYLLSHAPEPLGADYFYPQLQSGVTEPVVVTHVCYPLRVHCQLRELAQEIRLLSDSMAQAYSGAPGTADHAWPGALDDSPDDSSDESPDKPGAPCAACGPDGRWHRALLLATPQTRRGAQVLLVDLGRQELASRARLRPLLPEYFRMPVVTYPCALLGLWDGGRGWSRAQVRKLRALLLGRALNAKIEFYCAFEHVYYVTLYGHDGINLNRLFGTQTCCLAEKFLQSSGGEEEEEEGEEVDGEEEEEDPGGQAGDTDAALTGLRSIRLKPSAFYDAQVEFVASPSEFWIRLKKHHGPFSRLARRMCSFYSLASKREGVILKPEREDLCCVKWKDNGYYRAIVTKLGDRSVEVFLADRGNTEQVDWGDLRMLLPQFRRLPALALRCTLADVWPLGTAWSQEAVSFFKRTVLHKELVIHTLDKRAQQYVIEILDESRTGEENIGKVIAQAGYAKYQEFEPTEGMAAHAHSLGHSSNHFIAENDKVSSAMKVEEQISERDKAQSVSEALVHTAIVTNISTGGVGQEKENVASVFSSLTPLDFLTMKPGSSSKELEVGSTVKVKVFHVENPGDFWCQLARNPQEFRALMCDIEDYCKTTAAPYQGASPACLAKRAASGKWSRALVTGALSSERVRVHFVDYGDTGVVSVKDIYSASDEFLKVTALAFRCSLYNLIQPTGENPFVWDEKATQVFTEFVHNAVQNCLELNCMICAVVSVHNEQFNVVDLLTPFQSACHVLVEKRLARPVKPQKPLESSVQLHSYYYSAHDIKIGSEESVYITHVDDPCTFYCQLAKNVDILKHLSCHISQLIKVLPSVQTSPLTPGSLCLAKYTDGNWYRGLVIEQEPTKVFFVDFGNVYVTSDNLLPIPHDAYEVLLLPMQAVKCSLSDIPDQMPEEATTWFQETVLDKSMKALVVAKDPNGRLIIELYDDCSQINANINEKLGLLDYKTTRGKEKESETFLSTTETLKENNENVQFSPMEHLSKSAENQSHTLEILGESFKPKIGSPGNKLKHLQNSTVTNSVAHHQGSMENKNNQVFLPTREKKEDIFDDPPLKATKLEATLAAKIGDSHNEDLPLKFYAFPQKTLRPGFKTTVYVSHINDLSDFYVQLTEDEAEINHLSEKLNDVKTRPQHYAGPLQKGDVICAIFSEDSLWYRAVVKEQQPGSLLSVQFIDYGNVDVIHTDNIGRLDLVNARVPQLCIHCSLRGLWVPDIVKCKEVMHYFSQRTDEAQIRCEFVKFQEKWEVILADEHGIIAEDMISRYTFRREPQICPSTQIIKGDYAKSANKSDIDTTVLLNWHKPQMKTVRAYAMVVDGPEYFWCQFADTEKLEYLEVGVQTATKQTIHWRDSVRCPHVGEPCLVKYREDGHYYRALITNIHEDHLLSVRLIDFGNVEDCVDPKTVLNIPPELLSIPMQAFPCCLSGFNISEGSCPQQGNDYFYEIVTEDVLEITILEIKRDVCDVPLAIVDLRSKGESINEKMKKYSKISTAKMFLPYEKDGSEIKGGFGHPQPDVGFKKPSYKVVQDKALCVERQAEEHSERIPKYLNIVETKPSRFCDPGTDNIFEAFENPYEGGTGSVLESTKECYLGDQAVFDDAFLITEFSTLLPHAGEMAESLELNSFEVPLSPDEDLKEFLEVESLQLQHSPVREEHKEDLSLEPPMTPLSGGRDTKATLGPFPLRLPHSCESETHPVVELPAAPLSPEDIVGPSPVLVDEKAQKSECTEGAREAGCGDPVDNHLRVPLHLHGETCDPAVHTEMSLFEEKLQEYKNRDAISSLIPSLPEEELRDGRKQNHASPDNGLASQQQNTYTLEGFTVGSKCVVWSSLRNTWSKCEILEIAEQGTKVLNLSNGTEELVNPKDVWNGIPKLEKSPSEASFQTFGKDLYLLPLDDTTSKEEGSGGEPRFC